MAMMRAIRAAMVAAAVLAAPVAGEEAVEIRRIADGARIDGARGLAALARAHDLVVVGEVHDNPRHQALQAALAAALGAPAMAFEMVPRAAEAALALLRAAPQATPALREAAAWEEYAPYHVVLEAAPGAAVAGAGLSRDEIRRAMTQGAAAACPGDAAAWGLTTPLPEAVQADLEAELIASHCGALPARMASAMAEAQRLRDAAFAEALLRARASGGDGPALLITGNGHARRDRGAPAYLAAAAPELSVLTVLAAERREGDADWRDALARWTPEDGAPLYDVIAVTDPATRGDPCDAFRTPETD